MKKILQYSFLTTFLVFSTVLCLNAQPHAGEQSTGTVTGDRIGAGAGVPVGGGTLLLIGLAVMYGTGKFYIRRKEAAL
ncbi:MAG: hypothetical protein Q7U54_04370 [Bacteroidales bacterium]|nr:hypothetical protein [Bacteroidales bacterium]